MEAEAPLVQPEARPSGLQMTDAYLAEHSSGKCWGTAFPLTFERAKPPAPAAFVAPVSYSVAAYLVVVKLMLNCLVLA